MTKQELLATIRKHIREVTAEEASTRQESVLLDVREKPEFEAGHVPGATHLSRSYLEIKVEQMFPDRSTPIVTYCGGGTRSLLAADTLHRMGYQNVVSMTGGFRGWKGKGYEIATPKGLNEQQLQRYARHLSIPEVGVAGQQKLLNARVLLVGAGGLGSPCALYLAAAGVGRIGIVDFDRVDASNLQRQILHGTSQLGRNKTESAKQRLSDLNPDVDVRIYSEKLTSENIGSLLDGYQIVVDGCDDFATRYLVNEYCMRNRLTLVHGSVDTFSGQVAVFDHGHSCYQCLYAQPPSSDQAPSCAEAGVLGVVPGIVGSLQANEVIKLILERNDSLRGQLLCFDALDLTTKKIKLNRDSNCKICS